MLPQDQEIFKQSLIRDIYLIGECNSRCKQRLIPGTKTPRYGRVVILAVLLLLRYTSGRCTESVGDVL